MKIGIKQLILVGGLTAMVLFALNGAGAAEIQPVNPNIPGTNPAGQTNPNPVGIIGNLYQFALMLGGVLAFVMIIYAAIRYSLYAGNPSQQGEAKAIMKDALTGLALLLGAFIILNFVNPDLTTLQIKHLEEIRTPTGQAGSGPNGVCPAGETPESCNTLMAPDGGYCHEGSCYRIGDQASPFPTGQAPQNSNVNQCGGSSIGYCGTGQGNCVLISSNPTEYACRTGQVTQGWGCIRAGAQNEPICAAEPTRESCLALIANGTCKQGSCWISPECTRPAGNP